MSGDLVVVLAGTIAGTLSQSRAGRVSLTYDPDYATDPDATALSVSMPLIEPIHAGSGLDSWLSNLLPDNPQVLDRWATWFQVSASSPFGLLHHVGRDVAGGVQFVPAEQLAQLMDGGVTLLTLSGLEDRLADLEANPAAWTPEHSSGQFSLPGAQPKIALRWDGTDWGEPWGFEPTTHILKPPMTSYAHQELNEHLCLATSRNAGLVSARSEVLRVGRRQVIVIERYDRYSTADGTIRRVHQEDLCQAMGLPPSRKYQDHGGPGAADIIQLFARLLGPNEAADTITRFLGALAFAWATGATDAHAKNYSLLLSGPDIELAPLYDLNSALPYLLDEPRATTRGMISARTARLAMSVGGRRGLNEIERRDWAALAERAGLQVEGALATIAELVEEVPAAVSDTVAAELDAGKLSTSQRAFARRFERAVTRQAKMCRTVMSGRPAPGRRR